MTDSTLQVRSSFTECLILVTICGRSLFQRQQCQISKAYGDMTLDWTEQRQWLDRLLLSRFQVLSQCYPDPTESNDHLLLFTHILAQATVIYYCKTMIQSDAPSNFTQNSEFRYEHRALEASKNIIRLATTLPELPFSKVRSFSSKSPAFNNSFVGPPFDAHAIVHLRRVSLQQHTQWHIRPIAHPGLVSYFP